MGLMCKATPQDYLRLLLQLMPHGYAWQWNEHSAGRHLLAGFAEEFARFHGFVCQVVEQAISRFKSENYGWSCTDYQNLLLEKFGIETKVSDWQMNVPTVDTADCESVLWGDRFTYFIIITVPDVSAIPQDVKDYLNTYKQSHTAICWRNEPSWEERWDIKASTVDNTTCTSPLYEQDFHAIQINRHPSFAFAELMQYLELSHTKTHTRYYENREPLCTL